VQDLLISWKSAVLRLPYEIKEAELQEINGLKIPSTSRLHTQ
jgi:hypothetical protein